MKKIILILILPLCAGTLAAQTKKTAAKKPVATTKAPIFSGRVDSVSYAFGSSMASDLKNRNLTEINYTLLLRGFEDAFSGKPALLKEEEMRTVISNTLKLAYENRFAATRAEGKAFLEANKTKPGVNVTSSGLQYEVLTKGNGAMPAASDTVLVHYKGTFLNGKQFDSSYDRNEPLSLPLTGVIQGWTEGLQLMPAGSKYRFYIPYHLAYGESGSGPDMPPYSTLVFDIELLKVNGK
ncbi:MULTISPECIES: FKBP-type peptidyl-prolyl cis-trans isomerase [Pedobacter]|uniref:FKBP-type peptidyl-prolyl cis-trans isomerase n=1 Tax=Pedobacter TaxID=84567 RepID=UPI002109E0C7|nr:MULTISPECIES: FKBP-type peptidyl-prolyl cis-trans isomerase [unclassified Pedobacter]